jgi:HlyD family secretion protein
MTDRQIKCLAWCLFTPAVLLIGACSEKPLPAWSGYAEGDYLYIAAPLAGRLEVLAVESGQQVVKGAPLFALDAEVEQAARAEALARQEAARAQAANTEKGRRSDELAVTAAQLAQASTQAALARSDLQRQQQLVKQGFISKARLEDARGAVQQAQARVAELQAALRVARLPARLDERLASQASANAAAQVVNQATWRAQQKQQLAPASGLISDVFFRVGEQVPAGQPVLSLLPPENIKARFFISEAELATIALGQAVLISCDGCGTPIAAHISKIASQAEYTPPVIYSNEQRRKLVFMVEARPDQPQASRLHPGQPLDVRRAATGPAK